MMSSVVRLHGRSNTRTDMQCETDMKYVGHVTL